MDLQRQHGLICMTCAVAAAALAEKGADVEHCVGVIEGVLLLLAGDPSCVRLWAVQLPKPL